MNTASSKLNIFKLAASFCVLDIGYAISQTMLGPMVPELQATYNISMSNNGLLLSVQGIAGIIAIILSIAVADRFKKTSLMVIAYTLYLAMLFSASAMPPYVVMLIVFFFLGAGTKLFDALVNANMSEMHAENKGFFLNLLHACFGIGALIGPIAASLLLSYVDLHTAFLIIAVFCSVLLGCYFLLRLGTQFTPAPVQKGQSAREAAAEIFSLLKNKTMLLLGGSAMLYVGYSNGMSLWAPSYYMDVMGTDSLNAAFVVSIFWVGVITGRLTYSFLSLKFHIRSLILYSNLAGGTFMLAASIINSPVAMMAGYAISGFFVGAVVPLSIAMANKQFPSGSGRVSSIIMLFVSLGLMIIPALVGYIADHVTFYAGMFILNLCPLLIALLAFFLPKRDRAAA